MPLTLSTDVHDSDFPALMAACWEALEHPRENFLYLCAPILNGDRDASVAASAARQLHLHKEAEQPIGSVWVKVVDTDKNDKIVAGVRWVFYVRDHPFALKEGQEREQEQTPFRAEWWPEGPGREFATRALWQLYEARARMARRPQAFLHLIFVLPEYRRRGIGAQLLRWGLERADALGLESWLDATDMGRPLYERHGYIAVRDHDLRPKRPEGLSEAEQAEWKRYEDELLPIHITTMWRPAGGKYEEGTTRKPWEEEAEK